MATNYFPSYYQEFIHLSRYSRWLYEKGRREHWPETVDRLFSFFDEHLLEMHKFRLDKQTKKELKEAVFDLGVMPSMRCLMTAGDALKRENVAGYNCSFVAIDSPRAFDEVLYILMNGTGVGYSIESKYVNQLPEVAEDFHESDTTIVVADSKLGWAKALKELLGLLYAGQIPKEDTSKVRGAGSPLKTFGGRASGPDPLIELFRFCKETFKNAAGRRLTTLECHDIVCKIADIVVVGGVRRSALICISDLFDDLMRVAKSIYKVTFALQKGNVVSFDYVSEDGTVKHLDWTFDPDKANEVADAKMITNEQKVGWWVTAGQRKLANNSYAVEGEIPVGVFMKEWLALYDSYSGERGIFSRVAAKKQAGKFGRRDPDHDFGTNPCSEIILRNREFCNLTEVIVRPTDNIEDLKRKVRLATILGTMQSTLTNFKYITKKWRENCEEERLLGVSLTGISDNSYTNGRAHRSKADFEDMLEELRDYAVSINKEWADKIGIPQSKAVTCVKPSGTVSQLTDTASGIHARHNPYYIRTVRADKNDPLAALMIDMGFPVEDDITKPDKTYVFSFPMKSPEGSICRKDLSAIEQLELWLTYQRHWCEHKPSITVSVKDDEWMKVGAWVYEHFDEMSGVSFLPFDGGIYKQAPYQDCTGEEYEEFLKKMPATVDWKLLEHYEKIDSTTGSQELACAAGGCELK
jgi:ribonucleoside-triphosphate reductase